MQYYRVSKTVENWTALKGNMLIKPPEDMLDMLTNSNISKLFRTSGLKRSTLELLTRDGKKSLGLGI